MHIHYIQSVTTALKLKEAASPRQIFLINRTIPILRQNGSRGWMESSGEKGRGVRVEK